MYRTIVYLRTLEWNEGWRLCVGCVCFDSHVCMHSLVVVSITGMVFQVPIKSWRPDGEALGTTQVKYHVIRVQND